ncbi:MAG: SDR family oxidoreductase [Planctomycetaceae bacterium]|jgi:NAD(P)-dependent dehydrogenase (short-subunit alcohol dehydrogenase family)|nr:SDR family oxidoreductase [Planctomycetaceae bacterium]
MTTTDTYLQDLFGLDGRTAVVIGGTGVLGGAFCDALGGAGAHVVVVGRDAGRGQARAEAVRQAGGSAEFQAADSTSREDLAAIVETLAGAGRRPDILINGAGVNSATPFLEIEEEEWERIVAINLRGVRLACQVFGAAMLADDAGGSIINIASLSGMTALSRVFTYSATKAAVLNLTQNLAREWAADGIRVNALSPGFFPAEQNRKVLTPERVASIMGHTPMDRFGEPQELAGAVLLLAGSRAGGFLTGANIVVDGGFMATTI